LGRDGAGQPGTIRPVRIGCSGWNYADWRERAYPRGLAPRRWLAHYATLFDTVEVNSTFYYFNNDWEGFAVPNARWLPRALT